MGQARLTRDMALLRQHVATIEQYIDDQGGVYPIARTFPQYATESWYDALIGAGHYESEREIDPEAVRRDTMITFAMSMCFFYDADLMRPGHTVPYRDQVVSPVRRQHVLFPSHKGLVYKWNHGNSNPYEGGIVFCRGHVWRFAVAFADGSADTGTWVEFLRGEPLYIEEVIGAPVYSTWLGCRGMDR